MAQQCCDGSHLRPGRSRPGFSDLFNLGGAVDLTDDATAGDAPSVTLYDQDADAPAKPKAHPQEEGARVPAVQVADPEPFDPSNAEQLEMGLGPAAEGSPWRLPR